MGAIIIRALAVFLIYKLLKRVFIAVKEKGKEEERKLQEERSGKAGPKGVDDAIEAEFEVKD